MSLRHRIVSPRALSLVLTATTMFWAAYLFAYASGRSGVAKSSNGCNCHSSSANANGPVTVTLTGPQTLSAGSTGTYTLSVTGGPSGAKGGFDLSMDTGALVTGTNTKVSSGDLVQSNNSSRSWTFQWTAPATVGTVNLYAVGMASSGSGSSGDSWNWYGGSAGSPFAIDVTAPTPTLRSSLGGLKLRYR